MNLKYIKKRESLVLYSTSLCNLRCSYCYIDKNPALKDIDLLLEKSFKDKNYYIDFVKEIFPDINQLKRIEIWGGEPTLFLERIFPTLRGLIKIYPNLHDFMFSTNFVGEYWFDTFTKLLNLFGEYSDREFKIQVQLSLDGPKRINDLGRGEGTTEKFLVNFQKYLGYLQKKEEWIPKNIILNSWFKPTLSLATIPLLQTEKDVYDYYKFFDELSKLIMYYNSDNFNFSASLPNTAEPAPATKEDGILFANLCRLCKKLENRNKKEHLFSIYKNLVPYASSRTPLHKVKFLLQNKKGFHHGCETCGIGYHMIGLLPNKKISLCHNGFVDLLQEYKQYSAQNVKDNILIEDLLDGAFFNISKTIKNTNCSIEDLNLWADIVDKFKNPNSCFQIANITAQIISLAKAGLILEKYSTQENALEAARYFAYVDAFCLRNNLSTTGSMITPPLGTIKLLLNGALDYIIGEKDVEDNNDME